MKTTLSAAAAAFARLAALLACAPLAGHAVEADIVRVQFREVETLFDAGCKGFEYLVGGDDPTSGGQRIPRIEPDYADPIYLEKHGRFLQALGERYDGRPDIEFLDIGSYGIWGEWHTKNPAPAAVRKQIVDFYLQAFRKTPLVFMSDDGERTGRIWKPLAGSIGPR